MGEYSDSITVHVPPDRLFAYLSDVEHLPSYMPRLTSVHPHDGDHVTVTAHIEPADAPEQDVTSEAWLHVVEEGKSLEWGAPGPHDYRGRLHVDEGEDAGTCRLTVELHTEHTGGAQVHRGLKEALTGIKRAAESAGR
ncbi:SRPBCC family protein [Streptomyces chengbuensis]|uniref:SRPBCC family protein n=1 Tax=Streptomyces TaxID=1883 RepID=UPI0025B51A90|nr:SRPBCC family protein [Streptomyces sp. HUAS CB01]WJY54497.1 SRPBCC family protein [Streptomyces sp. HUAS CB01]